MLPSQPQGSPAGGQDLQGGAAYEQLSQLRRELEDVLEIVQHQQHLAVTEGRRHLVEQQRVRGVAEAECLGDGGHHI